MIELNGHKIFEPKDPHQSFHKIEGHCPICDGGLAICSICKKAEIELNEPCKILKDQDNMDIKLSNKINNIFIK
jgi:hypothetical protein